MRDCGQLAGLLLPLSGRVQRAAGLPLQWVAALVDKACLLLITPVHLSVAAAAAQHAACYLHLPNT
jgi:hypothetical protein